MKFDRSGGILFHPTSLPGPMVLVILVRRLIDLWIGLRPRVANFGRCFHWGHRLWRFALPVFLCLCRQSLSDQF